MQLTKKQIPIIQYIYPVLKFLTAETVLDKQIPIEDEVTFMNSIYIHPVTTNVEAAAC